MSSQKSYKCLHKVLLILVCLEIFGGLLTAGICEYTKIFLRDNIFQIDKHEVLSVVLMAKIYGLHVSVCFAGGIMVILLFKDVYTRHLKVCIILWMLLSIETMMGSLFISWLFSDTMHYVTTNFEESLQYGIKFYEADPQWILIFDNLQYNYKCCGVYNHTDWNKIVLSSSREENVIKLSSNLVLPYSCAKGANVATKDDDDNINSRGCFHVICNIIENINKAMMTINGFIAVDVILIIVMVRTVFIYSRIYSDEICIGNESEALLKHSTTTTAEIETDERKTRALSKREMCHCKH